MPAKPLAETTTTTRRLAALRAEAKLTFEAILAERRKLLMRLTELDAAMALIPKDVRGEIDLPLEEGILLGTTEMVRAQVKMAGPAGITSEAVIEAIDLLTHGGTDAPSIYAALSRGVKRGTFRAVGKRGSMRYFFKGDDAG